MSLNEIDQEETELCEQKDYLDNTFATVFETNMSGMEAICWQTLRNDQTMQETLFSDLSGTDERKSWRDYLELPFLYSSASDWGSFGLLVRVNKPGTLNCER